VTRLIPIDEQIAAVRQSWPTFRLIERTDRTALWKGPLRPLFMTYEVQIFYRVPTVVEILDPLRHQPRVRVLNPQLKRRRNDPEGRLPHVYWDDDDLPALCLFDPDAGEWTPACLLSETTIPWAIDWLACYEGWRATGEWTGGGRHLTSPSQENLP
jgi:hypothetical protein